MLVNKKPQQYNSWGFNILDKPVDFKRFNVGTEGENRTRTSEETGF